MANKRLNIRGGLNIKAGLSSGTGDPVLTKDAITSEVGQIPPVDTSAYLSTTLNSARLIVGNASNLAQARDITGAVSFSNTGVTSINNAVIYNQHIANDAGILYSKLILTNGIVNADINTAAGIARTKLASGSAYRVVVNNATGVMADNAAITANRVLISDNNGLPTHSTVTSTTLTYLDISSSLTTQLGTKLTFVGSPVEGDLLQYTGGAWSRLAIGTNGFVLTSNGTNAGWSAGVANGIPSGGTTGQYLNKSSNTDYATQWSTLNVAKITDLTATAAELNIMDGVTATTTEINYLSGVTSSIQTQLNSKLSRSLNLGNLFIGDAGNIAVAFPPGSNGQVLTVVGSIPQWQTPTPPGNVSGVAPSTDNAIVRWNGVGALSVQNSGIIIDDSNNVTGVTSMSSGQIDVLNQAELRLHETGSTNFVGLRAAGVMSADYTITLPAAAPSTGQYLQYNGTDYVWATGTSITPGGGSGAVQFNNTGAFAGSVELNWNNGANTLTIGGNTAGSNGVLSLGGTSGVATIASGGGAMDISAAVLTLYSTGANPINLRTNGSLRASISSTGAFVWGGSAGTSGQILKSNGSGGPPTWQNDTGFTLTNGNGTTAAGTAVNWGGTLNAAVNLNATSYSINFNGGAFNTLNDSIVLNTNTLDIVPATSMITTTTDTLTTFTATQDVSQIAWAATDGLQNYFEQITNFGPIGKIITADDGSGNSMSMTQSSSQYTAAVGDSNGDTGSIAIGSTTATLGVDSQAGLTVTYTNTAITAGSTALNYRNNIITLGLIGPSTTQGFQLTTGGVVRLKVTDAGVWSLNQPTNATGDIYYRDSSGNFVRRAIGSTGQILTVSGGLPVWAAAPAISDGNKGDITVSSSGTVWNVNNGAISFGKIVDINNGRLLGRNSGSGSSTGDIMELTDVRLGNTTDSGTERTIQASGSNSAVDLSLSAQGTGAVNTSFNLRVGGIGGSANYLGFSPSQIFAVATSVGSLQVKAADIAGTGGSLLLQAGHATGGGSTTGGHVQITTGNGTTRGSIFLSQGNGEISVSPVPNDDSLTQVIVRDPSTGNLRYRTASSISGGIADGDKGDITVSSSGTVWTVDNSAITFAKIQNSAAGLSVIGRGANSSGVFAEITAGSDAFVLRRSGTTLAFGTISTNSIDNSAITLAKIANISTGRVLGRTTASSGVVEELTSLILGNTSDSGTNRSITAQGSGSNIDLTLSAKGTGKVILSPNMQIGDGSATGTALFSVGGTADLTIKPSWVDGYFKISRQGVGEQLPYIILGDDNDSDFQPRIITTLGTIGAGREVGMAAIHLYSSGFVFNNKQMNLQSSGLNPETGQINLLPGDSSSEDTNTHIEVFNVDDHAGYITGGFGTASINDGGYFAVRGGDAYVTSGNGNGGSVKIRSGKKRAGGSGTDGNITIDALTGHLILANLPTSSAGLPSGTVWKNGTVLNIV